MTAIKRFASFDFHLILISVLRWCNSIIGMQLRPLMNIVKSHLCKHCLLWGCYSMYKWLNTLMMRSRGASNNVRVRALWIQLGWVPSTLEVWSNCCKWVQLVGTKASSSAKGSCLWGNVVLVTVSGSCYWVFSSGDFAEILQISFKCLIHRQFNITQTVTAVLPNWPMSGIHVCLIDTHHEGRHTSRVDCSQRSFLHCFK